MVKSFSLFFTICCLGRLSSYAQWASIGPGGNSLSSITFYDANYGWACGSGAALFQTQDGGATWRQQHNFETPGVLNRLRSVGLSTARRVHVIWETPLNPQPTALYLSENQGALFEVDAVGGYGTYNTISFHQGIDLNVVVGDFGSLRLNYNRGFVGSLVPSGTSVNLHDGDCPTNEVCYVVGDGGAIRRGTAGTLTAPARFVGQNSTTSERLNGVYFINATQGCVVGHNGTLLRTTNGGTTWTRIAVPTTVNLYDVWLVNANIGIAVGELGTILVTTDGGLTWRIEPSDTYETLYSLTATADGAHIWAAGDGGTVLKRGAIQVGIPTATRLPVFGQPWQVYPNPFTNSLTIDLPQLNAQQFEVSISDVAGHQVYQQNILPSAARRGYQLTLPTSLASGIYLLRLTADNQLTETRSIVKLP